MPLEFFLPFRPVFREVTFHVQFCQRFFFFFIFFFPGSELHLTKCSPPAFLACFLSTLLLIFALVHLAAASSRNLTFSGVLTFLFIFVLLSSSVFSWPRSRCSSVQVRDLLSLLPMSFTTFFFLKKKKLIDLLLSASSPSAFYSFFLKDFYVWLFLYSRENRIVVPSCPQSSCVVDVYFVVSSHGPDDVIQLRNFFFLVLTQKPVCSGFRSSFTTY